MDRNRLAYNLRKPENSDLKEEYSKMSRDGKRKFLEAFKQVHFKAEELRVQRRVVTAATNARVEKETFLAEEQLESALGSKERARRWAEAQLAKGGTKTCPVTGAVLFYYYEVEHQNSFSKEVSMSTEVTALGRREGGGVPPWYLLRRCGEKKVCVAALLMAIVPRKVLCCGNRTDALCCPGAKKCLAALVRGLTFRRRGRVDVSVCCPAPNRACSVGDSRRRFCSAGAFSCLSVVLPRTKKGTLLRKLEE